jgi:RNA polymerase sigma-70 factor (ECF subfamily)
MLLTELSDEDLMSRYQLGSEEAFAVLYDRHAAKVFSYVTRRFRKQERAVEVFQEVFVKVHRSKHLYNKTLPCLPWLFSVSRSVVLDNFRADERRGQETASINLDEFPNTPVGISQLPSLEPKLAQLPSAQRVAIQMRYVDESTFEEIASVLKTSPVNARQLISRAVKKLKELVVEGEGHEKRK